jgi:HK97 family phage prohead protease
MPYAISGSQSDCAGWATVKQNSDGSYETIACHDNKQDAIDQMVAVSIAEGLEPVGEVNKRAEEENEALIVDIDDTLLRAGDEPMQDVIDAVNGSGYAVYVVTGRDESRRDETEQALANAGVMYVDLIMQPADSTDTAEFKKQAATELVNSGVLIGAAVDNDQANLDAYASINIETYTPDAFVADQAEEDVIEEEQPMVEDNGSERSASRVYAGSDMSSTVQWVSNTLDERRSVAYTTLEMRESEDGNVFTGYAAVFDSPSEPMPFVEYVRKGAFTKTLKDGADVRLLIDHEGVPLARTKSGTLTLEEDDRGLRVEASLDPMNPDAQRVISAMRRGDLSQMSFAFRTIKDAFSADGMVRELREVQLFDVSVVTYPAYEDTIAELRRSQPVSVVPSGSLLARQRQIQIARHR